MFWRFSQTITHTLHQHEQHTHTHMRTHNGILLSHKKSEILPFAAIWMDLESIMLSEISQAETDKFCVISLICGI